MALHGVASLSLPGGACSCAHSLEVGRGDGREHPDSGLFDMSIERNCEMLARR